MLKQKNQYLNSGEHLYKYVLAYKKHWFLNEISRMAFRESSERVLVSTQKNDHGAYMTRFFLFNVIAHFPSTQPHPGFHGPSQPFLSCLPPRHAPHALLGDVH